MHEIREFFDNMTTGIGIIDVIDVAIVAFIIYQLLGLIRKSRAEQLVKGLVILFAIAVLSNLFNLYALNWVINMVVTMGIVAIVVIFQPELRRALEHMGRGAKFKASNISSMEHATADRLTNEFAIAMREMSKSRTGALIVFEREISLEDIAETGIILEAEISAQMIENIFYKGSPLHDGALIVRGDKLYAAACTLPLTDNKDLPLNMGTRHRAGIGITEASDAMSFILSEERGTIAMVEDGAIIEELSIEEVRRKIFAEFSDIEDKGLLASIGKRFYKKTDSVVDVFDINEGVDDGGDKDA